MNDLGVVDEELLHLSLEILSAEQYSTELIKAMHGYPLVLAENHLFVLILAATSTIAELSIAESVASDYLEDRIAKADMGAKRWDANVVLLTGQQIGRDVPNTRTLFDINYDTRGVRRLVRVGVSATPAGVREALRPFVQPIDYIAPSEDADPLASLIRALEVAGVDSKLAERAVAIFREKGDMSSVL